MDYSKKERKPPGKMPPATIDTSLSLNFKRWNRYNNKMKLENILFFEWLILKTRSYNANKFYSTNRTVEDETKLKRRVLESAKKYFYDLGVLDLSKSSTKYRAICTVYEIDFQQLSRKDILSNIYEADFIKEFSDLYQKENEKHNSKITHSEKKVIEPKKEQTRRQKSTWEQSGYKGEKGLHNLTNDLLAINPDYKFADINYYRDEVKNWSLTARRDSFDWLGLVVKFINRNNGNDTVKLKSNTIHNGKKSGTKTIKQRTDEIAARAAAKIINKRRNRG